MVLSKVLPPVLSGAAGVLATAWRYAKSFTDRLAIVEKLVSDLRMHFGEDPPANLKALLNDLRKELTDIDTDLKRRARERSDMRRLSTRLSDRYFALDARLDACEKSISDLNTSFVTFSKEQQDQWQDMTRMLGQVEGYLRGMTQTSGFSSKKENT